MDLLPTMTDGLARTLFAAVWIPFVAVRVHFHRLAGAHKQRGPSAWEGRGMHFVRVFIALPWTVTLLAWLLHPPVLRFASFPVSTGWRWLGLLLLAAGALWVAWVNSTLGRNFSGSLILQDDHQLVTGGPYRFMRHPMYPGFLVMSVGMLLLTANLWLGLPVLLAVAWVMWKRTPREEAMLLDRFGDEYVDYCARTGRFLPRLGGRQANEPN